MLSFIAVAAAMIIIAPADASASAITITSPENSIYAHPEIWLNWSADFVPSASHYRLNGGEIRNFTFASGILHQPQIASYPNPSDGESIRGIAFLGRYLYYTDTTPLDGMSNIYKLDSATFNIISSFKIYDISVAGMSMSFSGSGAGADSENNLMITGDIPPSLYRINQTRGEEDGYCAASNSCILSSAPMPAGSAGIAFDGANVWSMDKSHPPLKLRKLREDGTEQSTFTFDPSETTTIETLGGLDYDGAYLMLALGRVNNNNESKNYDVIYRINQTRGEEDGYCNTTNSCILSEINSAGGESPALAYDRFGGGAIWSSGADTNFISRHEPRNMTMSFPAGTNTIEISALDPQDNTIVASSVSFTVDTKPPELELTSPANATYNKTTIVVSVRASDVATSVAGCTLALDSRQNSAMVRAGNSTFEYNLTSIFLSDGPHTISISCADSAGNTASKSVSFSIDTTPPEVELISPANATYEKNPILLDYFLGEGFAVCSFALNGAAPLALAQGAKIHAEEGENSISVTCADEFGNTMTSETIFTLDTTATVRISRLPSGASLRINNILHSIGDIVEIPRGTEITIETTYNSRTYRDIFELWDDINLTVNAAIMRPPDGGTVYSDIASSYEPYSIYIIDSSASGPNTTVIFSSSEIMDNATLTGLHITGGGKIIIGDTIDGGYIKDLIVYGTMETISGASPSYQDSAGPGTIFGKIGPYTSPTGIFANTVLANDLLIKDTVRGVYIQSLGINSSGDRDTFRVQNSDSDTKITILGANITGASVLLDNINSDRINMKDPFTENPGLAGDTSFWYKARNTTRYNFTFGWNIRGNGNFLNISDIIIANNQAHSGNISFYSVWKDRVDQSYLNVFSLDTDGAVYLRSLSRSPSVISLIGPEISAGDIIIDDIPLSSRETNISFYTDSNAFTLPEYMMHDYINDTIGRHYSKNMILRSAGGHFIARNTQASTTFNLAEDQDIILLAGSGQLNLESASDSENEWSVTHSGASHWIIENTTAPVNLTGYISIQPDRWFLSSDISITSFAYSFNTTTLRISSSTDYADSAMYLLYRPLASLKPYQRMAMQKNTSTSLWHAYLPLASSKDYDMIIVAVENDGHSGKALEKTIRIENTPPAITQMTPSGDIKTNKTAIEIRFRASDDTSPELDCRLFIDSSEKASRIISGGTEAILSASGIPEGIHAFHLSCVDLSGNIGQTPSHQLTVDLTPPSLVIINSPNSIEKKRGTVFINISASDALSGIGSVSMKVTDRNGDRIISNLAKEGAYYTGSYNSAALADGSHSITVTALDAAGNSNTSSSVQVTTDNTGPYIHLSADKSSAAVGGAIRFTIAFDESDANRNTTEINIMLGSTLSKYYRYQDLENISSGLYRIYLDTSGMSGGRYRMTATIEDTLGNEGEEALEFTLSGGSGSAQAGGSSSQPPASSANPSVSSVQSFPAVPESETTITEPPGNANSTPIPGEYKNTTEDTSFNAILNTTAVDFSGRERALKDSGKNEKSGITGLLLGVIATGFDNLILRIIFITAAIFTASRILIAKLGKSRNNGIGSRLHMARISRIRRLVRR